MCCAKPDLLSGHGKLLCSLSPIRKLRGGLARFSVEGGGDGWVCCWGYFSPSIPAMRKVKADWIVRALRGQHTEDIILFTVKVFTVER